MCKVWYVTSGGRETFTFVVTDNLVKASESVMLMPGVFKILKVERVRKDDLYRNSKII